MLKIFIRSNKDNVIDINDVYFNKFTFKKLEYETARKIIKEIDGVELTQDFKITSKFTEGLLDLTKLSSGCKTVLNILYNQDKVFNVTSCGRNALLLIYNMSVGNIYVDDLITPVLSNIKCSIEVVSNGGCYTFSSVSELRKWYSEVNNVCKKD